MRRTRGGRRPEPEAGLPRATPDDAADPEVVLSLAAGVVEQLNGSILTDPYFLARCNICGRSSVFFWRNKLPYRESLNCAHCLATSRYRSLARGILDALRELVGVEAPSLADIPESGPRSIRLYDTQLPFYYPPHLCYPSPDVIARRTWIEVHQSKFHPDDHWGVEYGPRTTNQNLERLTFPDDYFDIVITSDVMEHVRLVDRAESEIARVLKPGGFYLFTVPHTRADHDHLTRVAVHEPDDPSSDEFVLEPEYHGSADPSEGGVLSYRHFGTRLDDDLSALGFTVEYSSSDFPESAIYDTELFCCQLRT
jgi:SAM-dependent methyltransferase